MIEQDRWISLADGQVCLVAGHLFRKLRALHGGRRGHFPIRIAEPVEGFGWMRQLPIGPNRKCQVYEAIKWQRFMDHKTYWGFVRVE